MSFQNPKTQIININTDSMLITTTLSSSTKTKTDFEGQTFGTTLNYCFFSRNTGISEGILITSIELGGELDINLSQCCDKCRGIPSCIIWNYYNNVCYFYSSFNSLFTTTTNSFVGIRASSQFWTCKDQVNKYYFEASLKWELQTAPSSKLNKNGCCQDCFWSKSTVIQCQSYMYNEKTRDCYHSNQNFSDTSFIDFEGIVTGRSFLIDLENEHSETISSHKKLSPYITIALPCVVLILIIIIVSVFISRYRRKAKEIDRLKKEIDRLKKENKEIQMNVYTNLFLSL